MFKQVYANVHTKKLKIENLVNRYGTSFTRVEKSDDIRRHTTQIPILLFILHTYNARKIRFYN